ncbi:gliding motility-associated C-terminal domain-containing protein [Muriicola soli]|uniref:Gliding motility-associated C-terminal domain-containing protein n=1 Tax=Muriicola soli TaxID=2507538 RepID=A0A411E6Z7_9FLAO|nr:gliding motility-associated C-terminal domain-containing protein [Muriicola soli]QBA63475.1 gliding motility-associated C-terminal domain-containing protein [Muriicola soli]
MKNIIIPIFLLLCSRSVAQPALYNSGNLRIHDQGQLGFHANLINDGIFDDNLGLVGFYSPSSLEVSGALNPVFFDVEIAADGGVILNTSVNVRNNTNFISGDFRTNKAEPQLFYEFLQDAFFVGESNVSKVDGYASMSGQQSFTFPVGDAAEIRPLILNSEATNPFSKCAYFYEDPNFPSTFNPFNTQIKPRTVEAVSTFEFWRLEGSVTSTVTLSWNARSNLSFIAEEVGNVLIMGWNKVAQQWLPLGTTAVGGDLNAGFVTSGPFIPDDFEIITFGSLAIAEDLLTLDNYYISPNGDGINDFLQIPELEQSPNNRLEIYDRRGLKVFQMENYRDEFTGISNVENTVLNRGIGLPEGLYFYIITMDDLSLNFQGFLFLER